jgi:hypothetical protein
MLLYYYTSILLYYYTLILQVLRAAMGLHLRPDMPLLCTTWANLYSHLGAVGDSGGSASGGGGSDGGGSDSGSSGSGSTTTIATTTTTTTATSVQVVVADAGAGSVDYTKVDLAQPSVLVIGSEAVGVSKDAYITPDSVVLVRAQIPMLRSVESFNAAVAGSILLAEAARQRGL